MAYNGAVGNTSLAMANALEFEGMDMEELLNTSLKLEEKGLNFYCDYYDNIEHNPHSSCR